MIVSTLLLISFVAGLAVRHAYADDEPLQCFCAAVLFAVRFPLDLARRQIAAARRPTGVVATMSDPFTDPLPPAKKSKAAAA